MPAHDARASLAIPIFEQLDTPGIGRHMAAGSPVRVGGGARAAIRPAPLLGADTDAVLHQVLGLDSGVIGRLHDTGVVAGYRPLRVGEVPFIRLSALPRRSYSGYNMARMRFAIILAPEVVQDLQKLKANVRTAVKAALETHLRHEPTKTSQSRIKRLRGLARPQYRLRVEEVRVFYDVSGSTVEVLAIVAKSEAQSWLAQFGSPA